MAIDPLQPVYEPETRTPITSAWGSAVANSVVQVFADEAERDARWINPPNGALCVTNNNVLWLYSSAWNRIFKVESNRLDFQGGYQFYDEGDSDSRFWFAGPDGGSFYISTRAGAAD